MSDVIEEKGEGRGRGKFTAAGVQAAQATDIETLKAAVAEIVAAGDELEARLDALEGA